MFSDNEDQRNVATNRLSKARKNYVRMFEAEEKVDSPTSQYIDMLLGNTKLNSPSIDPSYLQSNNYHSSSYISSFTLREEVDKFDFDHSLGRKEVVQVENEDDYNSDEDIEELLEQILSVKGNFQSLIRKIDNALVTEKQFENSTLATPDSKTQLLLDTIIDLKYIATGDSFNKEELVRKHGKVNIREAEHCLDHADDLRVIRDPCSKLNNYGVILIRWPESIGQLWDEYTKVPNEWSQEYLISFLVNIRKIAELEDSAIDMNLILQRKSSIQELEDKFSSGWRNEDKNFSRQINRRKKIWKSIEEALYENVPLESCIETLERYVRDLNKGISLYYKGVPFRIIEQMKKYNL